MIIICEPQCVGFEHSEFNAALITITQHAYSHDKIIFMAEEDHLSRVKKILDSNSVEVEYKVINVPRRNLIAPLLFPFELVLIKNVFNIARNLNCDRIIFSSIRRPSLVSVKLMLKRYDNLNCIIILHNIIEAVNKKPYELTEIPFWLRFWITFRNMRRLRYLTLGPSIENELVKQLPSLKNYVTSIDFPYFLQPTNKEPAQTNSETNVIKFGFFGVANIRKGAEDFFKLAKEIKNEKTKYKPEFIIIGPVEDKKLMRNAENNVFIPSPEKPLSSNDYKIYAEDLDYALIFHKPEQHQLTATASFFDAISHMKPVIAIKNPFIEYYFNKIGDVGYLCDNYNEIKELILNILENNHNIHYETQLENLKIARDKLDLKKISIKMATIWDEI